MRLVDDSGQKIVQTVYVECHSMYRREGPAELRSVGETEFANGMAAMSASGRYGTARVAAGIVGTANLRLGADVAPILEAQIAAGNGRLKGIRFPTAYADSGLFGRAPDPKGRAILLDPAFREGVAHAAALRADSGCLVLAYPARRACGARVCSRGDHDRTGSPGDSVEVRCSSGARCRGVRAMALENDGVGASPERGRETRRSRHGRDGTDRRGGTKRTLVDTGQCSGDRTSRPASKPSGRAAACSKATFRWTSQPVATALCGTPSN